MSKQLSPQPRAALLGRALLLLLVTAVIAGIFGMHIISGSHGAGGSHGTHAASPVVGTSLSHHAHGSSLEVSGASAGDDHGTEFGTCSCTQAASCIPSLTTASLSAPPPGTTGEVTPASWELPTIFPSWSYQPHGPTPGQLCISRT